MIDPGDIRLERKGNSIRRAKEKKNKEGPLSSER